MLFHNITSKKVYYSRVQHVQHIECISNTDLGPCIAFLDCTLGSLACRLYGAAVSQPGCMISHAYVVKSCIIQTSM